MPPPSVRLPLVDLAAQYASIRAEVLAAIDDAIASAELILGPNTRAFEDEFAAYCGARYAVAVANGTDALHLALRALGVGPGDEVITVGHTFIATIEAIWQAGARAVLVDIDPRTFNMAADALEAAITPCTRAIVPVHLYGRLADMDAIAAVARRHHLPVVEDASQAHGATDSRGRRAGALGDAATFSFYCAKNLGAYGEAGAMTTSDPALAEAVRLLRSHGETTRYEHQVLGFNSRPDEIQAAILRVKLRHLDDWNARRRQHAATYQALLRDLPLGLPELLLDGPHVYHQYVVRVHDRAAVRAALARDGIGTGVHYPIPVHLQPAGRSLGYAAGSLPETERAAREVLSLPMYPELSAADVQSVAAALARAVGEGALVS